MGISAIFCTFVRSIASFHFLRSQFRPRSIRAPRHSTDWMAWGECALLSHHQETVLTVLG